MKFNRIFTAAVIYSVLLVAPLSARAETRPAFKTPSGNIYCLVQEDNNLRCQILENKAKLPPQPADCNLDWGNSVGMGTRGKATRLCYGDTIANPNYPMLGYGKTWRSNGFTCLSKKSGLTCTNKDKKGWQISITEQKLF